MEMCICIAWCVNAGGCLLAPVLEARHSQWMVALEDQCCQIDIFPTFLGIVLPHMELGVDILSFGQWLVTDGSNEIHSYGSGVTP